MGTINYGRNCTNEGLLNIGLNTAAETKKAITINVERLLEYYKETYQEDEEDD